MNTYIFSRALIHTLDAKLGMVHVFFFFRLPLTLNIKAFGSLQKHNKHCKMLKTKIPTYDSTRPKMPDTFLDLQYQDRFSYTTTTDDHICENFEH